MSWDCKSILLALLWDCIFSHHHRERVRRESFSKQQHFLERMTTSKPLSGKSQSNTLVMQMNSLHQKFELYKKSGIQLWIPLRIISGIKYAHKRQLAISTVKLVQIKQTVCCFCKKKTHMLPTWRRTESFPSVNNSH